MLLEEDVWTNKKKIREKENLEYVSCCAQRKYVCYIENVFLYNM